MKKKLLIGILCLSCVILALGFTKLVLTKRDGNDYKTVSEIVDNSTYELRSYMTSKTFYITAPNGYEYDDDKTGTWNSKAVFTKENQIDTTLTYSFTVKDIDEYLETKKKTCYENKLESKYYHNLTLQDEKIINVNNNEIKYIKITYNDNNKYYNYIYSITSVDDWTIYCEIRQYNDSDNFDSDSKLIEDAWEISFSEEE